MFCQQIPSIHLKLARTCPTQPGWEGARSGIEQKFVLKRFEMMMNPRVTLTPLRIQVKELAKTICQIERKSSGLSTQLLSNNSLHVTCVVRGGKKIDAVTKKSPKMKIIQVNDLYLKMHDNLLMSITEYWNFPFVWCGLHVRTRTTTAWSSFGLFLLFLPVFSFPFYDLASRACPGPFDACALSPLAMHHVPLNGQNVRQTSLIRAADAFLSRG